MAQLMKLIRTSLSLVLLLCFLALNLPATPVTAASPLCSGPECDLSGSPRIEGNPTYRPLAVAANVQAPVNLPPMKAVLVVGPIDGPQGAWTLAEIDNAEEAALVLEANGVQVERFYGADTDWAEIKAAAEGAQFFMYRGHGIRWRSNPEMVGGFYLANEQAISSAQVEAELNLAPNAIVMLYACFAAGTTNDDLPPGISLETAARRVAMYSQPFFARGAGAYYADWWGQAFPLFLTDLFSGYTLGQAYQNFNFDPATFSQTTHPDFPGLPLWLDFHFYAEQNQYNHAFVGSPDQTLADLFGPVMQVGPEKIEYVAKPDATPKEFSVSIDNTLPTFQFTWSANLAGQPEWLEMTNLSGVSGEPLRVTINPQGVEPGVYTATVQIVSSTPGLNEAEKSLPINLTVIDPPSSQPLLVYIPFVISR